MKVIQIILMFIFVFVLYLFYYQKYIYESFYVLNSKWSDDLIKRFQEYQNTVNKNNNQFNLTILQQQVSPQEVEEYLRNGKWNWSEENKKIFIKQIQSNQLVNIEPQIALNYAMGIYNNNAITQLLAWNSKEGKFLLYGATDTQKNKIKCSEEQQSNLQYIDNEGKKTNINPEEIPTILPGFSFYDKPCNPCSIFNTPRDFRCPFNLRISDNNDNYISDIWKNIWNIS